MAHTARVTTSSEPGVAMPPLRLPSLLLLAPRVVHPCDRSITSTGRQRADQSFSIDLDTSGDHSHLHPGGPTPRTPSVPDDPLFSLDELRFQNVQDSFRLLLCHKSSGNDPPVKSSRESLRTDRRQSEADARHSTHTARETARRKSLFDAMDSARQRSARVKRKSEAPRRWTPSDTRVHAAAGPTSDHGDDRNAGPDPCILL